MIFQFMNPLFLNVFFDRLNEGGPLFMYPNFFILLLCIGLFIYAFIKGDPTDKWRKLLSSISLFSLVWGFLGQMIGLITAFDSIQTNGDISQNVLAGGLKVALLSPLFGAFIFVIVRIGIILLIVKKK